MSWANIALFFEFFVYMMLVEGKSQSGAQELSFVPGDELLEFVIRLQSKKNSTRGEAALIASAVEASQITIGIAALTPASTTRAATTTFRSTVVCSYCKKPRHFENRCYAEPVEITLLLLPRTKDSHKPTQTNSTPAEPR